MSVTIERPWFRSRFGVTSKVVWSVYPVTYVDRRYVAEFSVAYGLGGLFDMGVICTLYDYHGKERFLRKHRGKKVWAHDVSSLKINDEQEVHLAYVNSDLFKAYLPQIMKAVFRKYELTRVQIFYCGYVSRWDGVVSLDKSPVSRNHRDNEEDEKGSAQ